MIKTQWKRIVSILFLVIALSSVAVVYAADSTNNSKNSDVNVSGVIPVYTPGSGGILYILNAGMTNMVNQMDAMPDAKIATEATSGANEIMALSLDKAKQNRPYLASNAQPAVYRAYEGTDDYFTGEHPDLRAVAKLGYAAVHLVVSANSSIETFADLEGKTIGVGAGTAQETYLIDLLKSGYGLEKGKDYQLIPIGYQEVQQGIQDNSVDAGILMGALPAPLVQETAQTTDIRILSVDQEEKQKVEEEHPYYEFKTIEAGTYNGQDSDITIGSIDLITFTHKDTPEALVQNYLEAILENREEFVQIHGSAKDINKDTITEGLLLPIHPGAEKYYKETGIIKDED